MQWTLLIFGLLQLGVRSQEIIQNGPCPPGAATPNIILQCKWGRLRATDCNQLLETASQQGAKTGAVCGNSSFNNAECYLPPYPTFVRIGGTATVLATTNQFTDFMSLGSIITSSLPGGPSTLNNLITADSVDGPSMTSSLSASAGASVSRPPNISSPRSTSGAFNSNQESARTNNPTSTLSMAVEDFSQNGGLPTGTISAIVGSILGAFVLFCVALVVLLMKRDRKKTVFSIRETGISTPTTRVILDPSRMETEKIANLEPDDPRHSIWADASADH